MKTVLVTPELHGFEGPSGGIATFVMHFAELLQITGCNVTVVVAAGKIHKMKPYWWATYQAKGINIVQIPDLEPEPYIHGGDVLFARRAESVHQFINNADNVYFTDWQANGFATIRSKRFSTSHSPVCVTVLHGGTEWLRSGNQQFPSNLYDLKLDFTEGYCIRYSDFVVSISHFILDWLKKRGYLFPAPERIRSLGYPITQLPPPPQQAAQPSSTFKKLIFFGKAHTLKGFELFIDALILIAKEHPKSLSTIEEIVFLGPESSNLYGNVSSGIEFLAQHGLKASHLSNLDSHAAQHYISQNANDALVVIPSLLDNFPFTVIETSLLKGVNLICSRVGGIPEILGSGSEYQLFEPYPRPLAAKIMEWLQHGPLPIEKLAQYDVLTANQRWLAFHEEVCEFARQKRKSMLASITQQVDHSKEKSVDVCVPYFNHPNYLPQLLLSLENQTTQDFNVIVMNDGSDDPAALTVFEEMQQKYCDRGWQFYSQENSYLGAARNAAAAHGNAEYICFIDADDIASPQMVERFLSAIRQSGDDYLTCYSFTFNTEDFPFELATQNFVTEPNMFIKPLGFSPTLNMIQNMSGVSNCIIRRSVFDEIGGYTTDKHIGYEDYEFHTRLMFQQYKADVIPEFLFYYRVSNKEQSMSRTINHFESQMRVQRVYQENLRTLGLTPIATAVIGMQNKIDELHHKVWQLESSQANIVRETPLDSRLHETQKIEEKIDLLSQKLDTGLWKLQHQIDIQNVKLKRPPSPIDLIQGLYRFIIPSRIRLILRAWRVNLLNWLQAGEHDE